jgi:hypothetical protein
MPGLDEPGGKLAQALWAFGWLETLPCADDRPPRDLLNCVTTLISNDRADRKE